MLIIVEGADKSGKSTIVQSLLRQYNAVLIKKSYNQNLYPIDYSRASVYDWQAILDRVVLTNPNLIFIADRSFFTQSVYQSCFGKGEHEMTDEQLQMYNNYCKTVSEIPHLLIYCKSIRYELDTVVTNLDLKHRLEERFISMLSNSGLNLLQLNMDAGTFKETYEQVVKRIEQVQHESTNKTI